MRLTRAGTVLSQVSLHTIPWSLRFLFWLSSFLMHVLVGIRELRLALCHQKLSLFHLSA